MPGGKNLVCICLCGQFFIHTINMPTLFFFLEFTIIFWSLISVFGAIVQCFRLLHMFNARFLLE
jgi:hypothetical protein